MKKWIAFAEQTPPIYDETGNVYMLCLLNDKHITSIYDARCTNAAYWEKHKKEFRCYTHWLILPERPSALEGRDPHADCPLCHPELRGPDWAHPLEYLTKEEANKSERGPDKTPM